MYFILTLSSNIIILSKVCYKAIPSVHFGSDQIVNRRSEHSLINTRKSNNYEINKLNKDGRKY